MTSTRRGWAGAALLVTFALTTSACTGSGAPDEDGTAAPSPSASPTVTVSRATLTAKERAQQLTALAPEVFDATYRLNGKGPRPDAVVEMRMAGERFRLDVAQGRTTAVLLYGPRGVVSCQVESKKNGKPTRSCFLVARKPQGLPALFDPGIQRLFRSTKRAITQGGKQVDVKRDGSWKAPGRLGRSECFAVGGPGVANGTYCYLAEPGPYIGLLAKVSFPSGRLELRRVNRVLREGVFRPPVRPTPLPTGG